jgi:RecJ-like exonuclease
LKGRWSSLRGLRVAINGEKGLQYASLWIVACINLHAFAMKHEDGNFISADTFITDGRSYRKRLGRIEREWRKRQEEVAEELEARRNHEDEIGLLEGKLKREKLREELFSYLRGQNQ